MESLYIVVLMLLLVIIPSIERRRRSAAAKHIINKKKQKAGNKEMEELAKQFVGKECIIYTLAKYSLQGTTQGNGLTGGVPPVRFSM